MVLYDIVMIVILLLAIWRGGVRGIVWQVAGIASIICCFLFAGRLTPEVAPLLPGLEPPMDRWAAMLILYLGFSLIIFGAARVIRGWMEENKVEALDRHLGALFGLVKGVAFCLVVTFFLVTASDRMREQVMESKSGYAAAIVMDRLHPYMPDAVHDLLEPYIHQLDQPGMDLKHSHDGEDLADDPNHKHADPQAGGDGSLSALLKKLPGFFDAELVDKLKNAWDHTRPEDRDQLIDQLQTGVTGMNRTVAEEWQNGKPAGTHNVSQRSRYLKEIAAIYTDFPNAQETLIEEIETSLKGLPSNVSLAVLEDWHADVWSIKPDPDPGTGHTANLQTRTVRQLDKARIPVSSLAPDLRERLSGARR